MKKGFTLVELMVVILENIHVKMILTDRLAK